MRLIGCYSSQNTTSRVSGKIPQNQIIGKTKMNPDQFKSSKIKKYDLRWECFYGTIEVDFRYYLNI